MFNWLGNLFPYSDLHSLNLDWILTKMKETAAQAAKAIADAANALAQVAEAKAAALSAQTAAQNAQTAANNAQTAANNAADSAENAVNVAQAAKSAAQTAQNTANTAQSAAETAQSAAETAQSAAGNAQTDVDKLEAKFPITTNDVKSGSFQLDVVSYIIFQTSVDIQTLSSWSLNLEQPYTHFNFYGRLVYTGNADNANITMYSAPFNCLSTKLNNCYYTQPITLTVNNNNILTTYTGKIMANYGNILRVKIVFPDLPSELAGTMNVYCLGVRARK